VNIVEWEKLPQELQTVEVRRYYNILKKKKTGLFFKRLFDIVLSLAAIALFFPIFLILAIAIKLDTPGPVFFRQERVTQYGKCFRIHKFRTMVQNADKGAKLTVKNDSRITGVGKVIRSCRLDETAQLIDVLQGTMTFVGVRPELPKFVAAYTNEMMATLLLPAGITSLASIYYKDEAKLLDDVKNVDQVYIEKILPGKMYYNLKGLEECSFWNDIKIMFMTAFAVLGKEYKRNVTSVEENSK
jgi:lipopolysaccharide/colanic/teichoic acid biosynthesis glycosyltransferase